MRRGAVLAALTALGAAAIAFGARMPDTLARPDAVYARRGSLGANDYVATNVAPCKSAYRIFRVTDGRLHDRGMNVVTVTNDATFSLPPRRLVAGFARSFCVSVSVDADAPCRIGFTGAERIWVTDSFESFSLVRGRHLVQFTEIGDNEYAADVNGLVETEGGM